MRFILSLLALLMAPVQAVDNVTIDISSTDTASLLGKPFFVPITTTESTVTFIVGSTKRKVQWMTRTRDWGQARASGVFSTKFYVDADRVNVLPTYGNTGASFPQSIVYYVATATNTDTIQIQVVE